MRTPEWPALAAIAGCAVMLLADQATSMQQQVMAIAGIGWAGFRPADRS
jgi:hypothetical protein